jgi:S-DNA-T family DNA segregation ATPase FtsK/SpoIIIE
MASYQARRRDPLLDQSTQAMIERRGKELLGLGLIAAGAAVALMLATYAPEDPGWFAATDAPVRNALGRFGASLASPLTVIVGWAAWGIALVLGVWGIRFLLHRGEERVLARIVFAPIAIALGAIYAATHVPPDGWTHSFGLGGLFGDTVLGALLALVPFGTGLGLRLLAVAAAAGMVAMALFVLAFDRREVAAMLRFLLYGAVLTYDRAAAALAAAAGGARRGAAHLRERLSAAGAPSGARGPVAAGTRAAMPPRAAPGLRAALHAPPLTAPRPATPAEAPTRAPLIAVRGRDAREATAARTPPATAAGGTARSAVPPRAALFKLLPLFARRPPDPEPELIEPAPRAAVSAAPPDERVRARIADAILNRRAAPRPAPRSEPALTRATPAADRPGRPPPLIVPPRPAAGAAADPPAAPAASAAATPFLRSAVPSAAESATAAKAAPDPFAPPPAEFAAAPPPPPPPRPAAGPRPPVVEAPARGTAPSRRARAEREPRRAFDERPAAYTPPPLSLLAAPTEPRRPGLSHEALAENARMLETVLDVYGVKGEIVSVRPGPVVTLYELEPAPGLKASRVIGLADDIARSMSALSARVSTVPGRSVIGIELPNPVREKVMLRELLASRDFGDSQMRLPLALGKDIAGEPVVANLAKMPHLLIAGTTGSGKSVAINTMILSLLYRLGPEECRLIMIDPKMLELSVYDGIPHLLAPVVTDPKKAVVALKWVVGEMEERYRKMSRMNVRNIEGYNGRVREALEKGEMFRRTIQTGFDEATGEPVFETEEFEPKALPYIVVVVDEMADLMMVAGKEIEACIQRLAQMARASGIHLIMATQRPSVDVITGTIKANFPTRISFQVTSKIDSRTILGEMGAEQLLGQGDMLYMAGGGRIMRVHGPFVSDEEVEEIVTFLKSYGPPDYVPSVLEGPEDERESEIDLAAGLGGEGGDEALYDQAVAIVLKERKVSTSYIQRKLGIGYNKAARLVEQMEAAGLVSAANHVGKREILVGEAG